VSVAQRTPAARAAWRAEYGREVNVLLVRTGVNMGDHAETITTAVAVDPEETIGAVVERLLMVDRTTYVEKSLETRRVPDADRSLVLRMVAPIE
jgi:hypothetical protein